MPAPARNGDAWLTYLKLVQVEIDAAAALFDEKVKEVYEAEGSWHLAEERATKSANAQLTRECKAVALKLRLA